jgi:hypothetical protein
MLSFSLLAMCGTPPLSYWLPGLAQSRPHSSLVRPRFLCCLTDSYISNHFHAHGLLIALMMEAARTSETLVNFYQTRRRYNPEDSHHQKLHNFQRSSLHKISVSLVRVAPTSRVHLAATVTDGRESKSTKVRWLLVIRCSYKVSWKSFNWFGKTDPHRQDDTKTRKRGYKVNLWKLRINVWEWKPFIKRNSPLSSGPEFAAEQTKQDNVSAQHKLCIWTLIFMIHEKRLTLFQVHNLYSIKMRWDDDQSKQESGRRWS